MRIIKNLLQALIQCFKGKKATPSHIGTIKFFDRKKRFGFIVAGKHEYFFHAAATKPKDFKSLKDGAKVQFKVIQGKKGPQADKIEVIQ